MQEGTSIARNEEGVLQAWVYVQNYDTWSCPPSTFHVTVQVNPPPTTQYEWSNLHMLNDFVLSPGNGTGWVPFKITFLPGLQAPPNVSFEVSVSGPGGAPPLIPVHARSGSKTVRNKKKKSFVSW